MIATIQTVTISAWITTFTLKYDIILTVSTFSATAPLTAKCKEFGFRGATLHGLNQIIFDTGLSPLIMIWSSEEAEKLRLGLTKADRFEIDFEVENKGLHAGRLHTNGQEAQKAMDLCPPGKPDVANSAGGRGLFCARERGRCLSL